MQKHLDNYLKTVSRGLELVPASEREKEISELREHLDALAQAHLELGESEENAAIRATQQFGPALTVRRRLFAAYWRRRLSAFCLTWPGTVVCTTIALYTVINFVPRVLENLVLDPLFPGWRGNPNQFTNDLLWYSYGLFFLQCCLFGWLSQRLSGRRCLPVLALLVIGYNLRYIAPQFVRGPRDYEDWSLLIVVASGSLVLPLLTAYISLRRSRSFRNA